jgi:hypothetical protein
MVDITSINLRHLEEVHRFLIVIIHAKKLDLTKLSITHKHSLNAPVHPGPNDLLVRHRASWGILPQTPVFSLRSARCH